MIVKTLKVGIGYALGHGQSDPRMPLVIDGDVDGFKQVCAASKSAQKAKHFALSYDEADRPDRAQLVEDVRAFLGQIARGRPHTDLAYAAILHHEPAGDQIGDPVEARKKRSRYSIHLFVAEVDLATGKRLQLLYTPVGLGPLWAWLKRYNQERGYACPTDPCRARTSKPIWSQDQLNALAAGWAGQTRNQLESDHHLDPDKWAALLKSQAGDGRIQSFVKDAVLVARVTMPGMFSAGTLKLQPNGKLSVRAAKANQRRARSSAGGKGAVSPRFQEAHQTPYRCGAAVNELPNLAPAIGALPAPAPVAIEPDEDEVLRPTRRPGKGQGRPTAAKADRAPAPGQQPNPQSLPIS